MTDSKEVILAEGVRERLNELGRDIQNLKDEIPILELERRVLLGLLDHAKVVTIASNNGQDEQLQGPTKAVLNFVANHPGAVTNRIAHELQDRIKSDSPNRKQIIYTVLSQLRQAGKVYRDKDSRHFIQSSVVPDETHPASGIAS